MHPREKRRDLGPQSQHGLCGSLRVAGALDHEQHVADPRGLGGGPETVDALLRRPHRVDGEEVLDVVLRIAPGSGNG